MFALFVVTQFINTTRRSLAPLNVQDHLIINGEKIITSPLQHVSMDIEGDTSTLIKAYCNLPLSYEEYSWVEEYAPSFLPDLSKMTEGERTVHKIQMLQLQLQR